MSAWRDRWAGWAPRLAVVAHDLAMVWLVWQVLHRLRYATMAEPLSMPLWSTEIALVLLAQALVFWQVGLYRGLWRFASLPDLVNIVKASVLGLVAIGVGRHQGDGEDGVLGIGGHAFFLGTNDNPDGAAWRQKSSDALGCRADRRLQIGVLASVFLNPF